MQEYAQEVRVKGHGPILVVVDHHRNSVAAEMPNKGDRVDHCMDKQPVHRRDNDHLLGHHGDYHGLCGDLLHGCDHVAGAHNLVGKQPVVQEEEDRTRSLTSSKYAISDKRDRKRWLLMCRIRRDDSVVGRCIDD